MDDTIVALGARMKAAREGLPTRGPRFSPEAMARTLNVTRDTVVRWESGEIKPPFDRLVAYCRVLRTRGFPGKDALKIICLGYPNEVSELQRCNEITSTEPVSQSELTEVATIDILEEIREISDVVLRRHAYLSSIFGSVAESLIAQNVYLEAWSGCYGFGDYKSGEGYRFRSGFRIGWAEFSGNWQLIIKFIEERTYDEAFLGYQYASIFEHSIEPILSSTPSVQQRAAAELPRLLEEVRDMLKQIPGAYVKN